MDDHGGGRVTGIRQIVRLKELLQKWQSVALISKSNNNRSSNHASDPHGQIVLSPELTRRLREGTSDVDEENCQTPEPPPDVPKGYLAVYVGVGEEHRRFIIPTSYLSHNLFKMLLEKVEEEYGFDHAGALTIPCEVETFKYLLKCIETHPVSEEDPESGNV